MSDDNTDSDDTDETPTPWGTVLAVFVGIVLLWGAAFVTRPLDRLLLAVPGVLILPPVRRRVVAWIEAEAGQELPGVARGAAAVVYGLLTVAAVLLMGGQAAEQNAGVWSSIESWGVMVAFAALLAFLVVRVAQSAQEEGDDEESEKAAS